MDMLPNVYAEEKTAQIERERLERIPYFEPPRRRKRALGPLAGGAGRVLQRVGEGLESWGASQRRDSKERV
jgi:hypothetical protein